MKNASIDTLVRTLVILKPEVIERKIVGKVLDYFDRAGFTSIAMVQRDGSEYQFRSHYKDVISRVGSSIGDDICRRMTRGQCIFIIYEGVDAIARARSIVGATDPATAASGTIRAEYGTTVQYNVVHASDSPESADAEISIWFPEFAKPSHRLDLTYTPVYYTGC